jgi:acetoacetyl-CoA synthetase
MSQILWTPSPFKSAQARLTEFQKVFGQRIGRLRFADYAELHRESIQFAPEFWNSVWDFCGVIGEKGNELFRDAEHMTDAQWFPQAKLNFAENLLHPQRCSDPSYASQPALIAYDEHFQPITITRQQLLESVYRVAHYLRSHGVQPGDRVAAVLPNRIEAAIAMLGTTAIGAIWSSCSPDFGVDAIADRFAQIEPKIMITTTQCQYNGKRVQPWDRVATLLDRLTSVERVLLANTSTDQPSGSKVPVDSFEQIQAGSVTPIPFDHFDFNHPVFILYSSGTTGAPKCIVHGAGGTLLQHLKEHQLHSDIHSGDRLIYYTTTGWMMWNWLVTVLASDATAVLYDGSPLYPDAHALFRIAQETEVTHFGASAKYFATLDKEQTEVGKQGGLEKLRCILSTGSPLLPETFDYIYRSIKSDVNLASISGGTDIVSCFALGNPLLAVRRGEIQCKGLGMDVAIMSDECKPIVGTPGELVCRTAIPSMPIYFWNDPGKQKYLSSYFGMFDNTWCHGDWAEETVHGGLVIYGRSDATLNPGGVRIGTAEIYQQIESFEEVQECLATALRSDGDEQIVLFVRLRNSRQLDEELQTALCKRIREKCSPRHVPRYLIQAPDFPRTISGKLSEIAVRNAINRTPIRNTGALANPESLDFFHQLQLASSI